MRLPAVNAPSSFGTQQLRYKELLAKPAPASIGGGHGTIDPRPAGGQGAGKPHLDTLAKPGDIKAGIGGVKTV
jgi:hypothetical protein